MTLFSRSSYSLCLNSNVAFSVCVSEAKPDIARNSRGWIWKIFWKSTAVVCCWFMPRRLSEAMATHSWPHIAVCVRRIIRVMRAFKRRFLVSKRTRFCRGKRRRERSETDFERSLLRWLCARKSGRKKHTSRTDDGGAVVAHHAHD